MMLSTSDLQQLFPKISRFITELPRDEKLYFAKIFSVSLVSGFLLVAIALKGVSLVTTIGQLQATTEKKQTLREQQVYWEKVVGEHEGYRDAYFQLAVISYQLGEKEKAQTYLSEAMVIDPQFARGKEFAKKLEE